MIDDLSALCGARVCVSSAPGWKLNSFADLCFSRRTCDEVLLPTLSDMQIEYFEALREGRFAKARWVQLRGYLLVVLDRRPASGAGFVDARPRRVVEGRLLENSHIITKCDNLPAAL
jgi:hypothetical protein